ncbi:MAG TPA: insulinase family protein [Gammaproteobacteria bacterium]|nr:insulinase family protein [Gammaproteobacteria bacterium]
MLSAKNTLVIFFSWALCVPVVWATPAVQHWNTHNGAEVYFVAAPQLPMVDVRITFNAGAARDGDHPGLAQLTNSLLGEGAGGLSADEIAARFEDVGASFGASSHRDMAVVRLRSLTQADLLEPAVATLALVLRRPDFPADAFKREQSRTLVGLRAQKESPGEQAGKRFFETAYAGHPYAVAPSGTEMSVAALTVADVKAYYQRYYVGRNAVVAIVGALSQAQAAALAEQTVGVLPAGKAAPDLPLAEAPERGEEVAVAFPSEQTHILMGQPVLTRDDPDYFPLYVGNHVLGGSGLVSRISTEVREKRGLSYSAYSYFSPMAGRGPFIAGLQTRNEQAREALKVLRQVVADFIQNGPTAAELEAAKKNITGGFPLRLDSNSKIVDNLGMIGFYNLPLDYLDTFNARVQAVTVAQVRDAFRRRLNPDRMVTVVLGGGQGGE